ncbi:LysE family translocator [Sneathiella sp.]|uniref:LysE family translocator n=1 Tax=Sneathiella sp. TaxID=1964365 RepID=UPI003561A326
MPTFDLLMPFFIATAIFACIPGPGLLYAAARTISNGRQAGWLAAVGLHLGGYVHICAAALGLAILLKAVPVLYEVVKLVGAAYLIWLGYRMFISRNVVSVSNQKKTPPVSRKAMTQSIAVEILNPKTALFHLSFLPQFTDPGATFPIWLQILILGTIVNFMFSITDVACVLLSAKAMRLFSASRTANRLAHRVGGGILIALGVNLAASRG